MIATDSLERLFDEAATHGAQPLWTVMEAMVPPHPEPKAVPHVWRYAQMRPLLERQARSADSPKDLADRCEIVFVSVALAATAEAFVMGAKGGLDPEVMLAAINAGSGRNSATEGKFPAAVLTRSFDYGAEMHIPMKDIDLAIAHGEELGVPMWVCQAARLVFKHAMRRGAANEDLTAIVKYVERDAGFALPKTR